ncbi:Tfx family DNA-binding protein [Haladaptatus cibarius]|uniref:Tfx family DNA-binding protein n=1 Tax=Haladaptatus cibarius TaxID=453847 RepID=UPI00373FDB2F
MPSGQSFAGRACRDEHAGRSRRKGDMSDEADVDEILRRAGFSAETSVLTQRQAEVLVLRERGVAQADIAGRLGTSRANVSSVEASARENISKARETVAFAKALRAPVRIEVEPETDLYDVPSRVYDACDEAGVKVNHAAPELMKRISDDAGDAIEGRAVRTPLLIGVTHDGEVTVRQPSPEEF